MGKIFYLMGKSAAGKDSMFKRLIEDPEMSLKTVTMYTTRPLRDGETNGIEYFFTSQEELRRLTQAGKVIEQRTYQTIHGPWSYFTVDDGQIDLCGRNHYLMMGTLKSFQEMRHYFGDEAVFPIYLFVEDGERLIRAVNRERQQSEPRYKELCRRFLSDEEDFSSEKLKQCGIVKYYENHDMDVCFENVKKDLTKYLREHN